MPKVRIEIPIKRAEELLFYNPLDGTFRWKVDVGGPQGNRIKAGSIAGGLNKEGYRYLTIDGKLYSAHRLAWAIMSGETPNRIVDHRDGNLDNNRIDNLRLADDSKSMANREFKNKHGLKGVSTKRGLFRARIYHEGRSIHIGYYATKEEAHKAYEQKSLELQGKFSVFARE